MRNDRTSGASTEAERRFDSRSAEKSSGSVSGVEPYGIVLPTNINVFSSLAERIVSLEDHAVVEQVRQVIFRLNLALQNEYKRRPFTNYLPRINLIQQEDKAALLEWNFSDFRVGFTLEPKKTDSSYFIVSQDKSVNLFEAKTQKIETDLSRSVDIIVQYVLENT